MTSLYRIPLGNGYYERIHSNVLWFYVYNTAGAGECLDVEKPHNDVLEIVKGKENIMRINAIILQRMGHFS